MRAREHGRVNIRHYVAVKCHFPSNPNDNMTCCRNPELLYAFAQRMAFKRSGSQPSRLHGKRKQIKISAHTSQVFMQKRVKLFVQTLMANVGIAVRSKHLARRLMGQHPCELFLQLCDLR